MVNMSNFLRKHARFTWTETIFSSWQYTISSVKFDGLLFDGVKHASFHDTTLDLLLIYAQIRNGSKRFMHLHKTTKKKLSHHKPVGPTLRTQKEVTIRDLGFPYGCFENFD